MTAVNNFFREGRSKVCLKTPVDMVFTIIIIAMGGIRHRGRTRFWKAIKDTFLSIEVAMKSNIVASDINTATVEPYDKSDNVVEATAKQSDRCLESPQYIAEQQMQTSSNSLRSILLAYYSLIDSGAIDEVLGLFSEDATYMRCESLYSGIAEIEHFYRNERKIRGSHELKNLWVIGRTGIVEGIFSGRGVEGQSKHVGFADIFIFDQSGRISDRHTYLQLQSNYVKE